MKATRILLGALFFLVFGAWGQPRVRLKAREAPVRGMKPRYPDGTHYILQFNAEPGPAEQQELERRGMHVLQYVPDAALMVASRTKPDVRGLDVFSIVTLSVSDKISPVLAEQVSGALLVIFQADVSEAEGRGAARDLGFDILENRYLIPGQLVLAGPHSGIEALAARDEVAYILPASPVVAGGLPVAACGGAASQAGPIGEYVLMGAGWPKDSVGKVALQYFIRSLTDRLDTATSRSEIERALREWTRYTNLSLTPAAQQGGNRTIDILFARGVHGDSYPFDGPGGALAHTFYPAPSNPEPIAGDMHFDGDEPWSVGNSVDLYSVALHEAGHALGLGHSDRPGSVMYPYYRLSTGLSDDDIAGIRALYGNNATVPGPAPTPPAPPTPVAPPTPPPAPPVKDTISPSLQIDLPGFTIGSTAAAAITISGRASDNVAVTTVKWTSSSGSAGAAAGTTAWSASVPLLVGTNAITVRAYDAAGNSAWRTITVVRH